MKRIATITAILTAGALSVPAVATGGNVAQVDPQIRAQIVEARYAKTQIVGAQLAKSHIVGAQIAKTQRVDAAVTAQRAKTQRAYATHFSTLMRLLR